MRKTTPHQQEERRQSRTTPATHTRGVQAERDRLAAELAAERRAIEEAQQRAAAEAAAEAKAAKAKRAAALGGVESDDDLW